MRSYDWGQLFPEHILDRGRDYGENGQVDLLSCVEGLLKARVYGTDVYDVRIRLHGNEVDEMSCTCPYAAKGLNCKHMAAVLFDWFEGDPEEDPDEDETGDDEEDARAFTVGVICQEARKHDCLFDSPELSALDRDAYGNLLRQDMDNYTLKSPCSLAVAGTTLRPEGDSPDR